MSTFQVIQGGLAEDQLPPASPPTQAVWIRKLAELEVIRKAVDATAKSAWGPRKAFAAEIGAITLVAGLLVGAATNFMAGDVRPQVFFGMPIVLAISAYLLAMQLSRRPLTTTGQLDRLLHMYDPVNREAYRLLQKRTRMAGSLEAEYVIDWLDVEHYALQREAGWLKPDSDGFISKTV